MSARRICVITAARSEYGAAKWLMKAVKEDAALELQVVVTGSHLDEAFGSTRQEIEEDGFEIDEIVGMGRHVGDLAGLCEGMGRCLSGMGGALARLGPAVVVVLGDRYELLPICTAAMLAGIPLAHVSGGDITEGAFDDCVRHAVTKMAHLHFPAHEAAAEVIRGMGELRERIFPVGELSLEAFYREESMSRAELASDLGLDPGRRWILLAYHPVTLASRETWLGELRAVLAVLEEMAGIEVLMTYPNADPGNEIIREVLHQQAAKDPGKFKLRKSLGHRRFVSLLRSAHAMVGNSSSGLIEAPSARLPAINVGDRQKGRVRGVNVIDAAGEVTSIARAFAMAERESFREALVGSVNPYGDGSAARRMVQVIREVDLEMIRRKRG